MEPLIQIHSTVTLLPGRQCVSLSMVVAIFLCCTRHCCSSTIEVTSCEKTKLLEGFPETRADPDWTKKNISANLFAIFLKTPVSFSHLTLTDKKDK